MRAKTKEELKIGDELVIFSESKGERTLQVHKVTGLEDEVVVDDIYDLEPNEDGHYFVLPKL